MTLDNQVVEQAVIVNKSKMKSDQSSTKLALFNENGTPVSFGGSAATWDTLAGKPEVVAAGETAADARAAIGAGTGNGTSNVTVATAAPAALGVTASVGTSARAAREDHVHPRPTLAELGAPAIATAAPAALGASAAVGTSAKAAREDHVHARPTLAQLGAAAATHEHTPAQVTGLQAILDDLTARVSALESAT